MPPIIRTLALISNWTPHLSATNKKPPPRTTGVFSINRVGGRRRVS